MIRYNKLNKNLRMVLVLLSVLIASLIIIPTVMGEPMNQTNETADENITADDNDWYEAEWGGDTGGEEYTAPTINNGTRSDEGGFFDSLCSTSLCSTSAIFGICIPAHYIQKRKKGVNQ